MKINIVLGNINIEACPKSMKLCFNGSSFSYFSKTYRINSDFNEGYVFVQSDKGKLFLRIKDDEPVECLAVSLSKDFIEYKTINGNYKHTSFNSIVFYGEQRRYYDC